MTMKLILPRGTTGFRNDKGEWVATGSQMGRPNRIPSKLDEVGAMRLQRLPMAAQGDYDKWGAYWGIGTPLYIAWTDYPVSFGDSLQSAQIFVRAMTREAAKQSVLTQIPSAKFYR